MAWLAITVNDVRGTMTLPELEALFSASGDWHTQPIVTSKITNTIAEVRGYIGASPDSVALGTAGTIPSGLMEPTLAIIRYRILTAFPELKTTISDDRRAEYRDAMDMLQRVAEGKFAVTEEADGTQQAASGIVVVQANTRECTRATLDGV